MAKEICISSTPHETRLAILEDDQLSEIYYERENEYTLAGSIYNGRVTRVLPGMQSAFVDLGLERDAFLYVTDFVELEDQEDSDEVERAAASGASQPPREIRRSGEPDQAARSGRSEERKGRSGRQDRPRESQPVPEAASATPPPPSIPELEEPGQEEGSDPGAKRWRGRRHRRGRGRETRSGDEAGESQASEPVSEAGTESAAEAGSQGVQHGVPQEVQTGEFQAEESTAREPQTRASRTRETRGRRAAAVPASTGAHGAPGAFLLPGESLSKYGGTSAEESAEETRKPAEAAAARRPAHTSKPSTLVEAPLSWDGSGLLPGESMARHRGPEEKTAAPDRIVEEALANPAEELAPPALHEIEVAPVEPVVVEENKAAAEILAPRPEEEPAGDSEADEGDVFEEEQLAGPGAHEHVDAAEAEADGSASHRIDPATPSGFRLFGFGGKKKEGEESDASPDAAKRAAAAPPASVSTYAPGNGVIEEEVIEGEEFEAAPHRRGIDAQHDLDDYEEETLRTQIRSGDIGEMLQEAHLDHKIQLDFEGGNGEDEEGLEIEEEGEEEPAGTQAATPGQPRRERNGRGGRHGRGDRPGNKRGPSRRSMQTTDLPVISDLLKPGQEILVQIAKEPIAKKGARITSHIALPGRFLVFMPTVTHVGVSRKIASDEERHRLKRILINERGESAGGFIVRTAAEGASEDELRADLRFLMNLWNDIKQRSESSKSPALIYHDLSLIERILRDQVSENFSNIWVDSEADYERIVRFLNRFSPSLVRRVKLYTKETPLFEHFGIQDEISKALRSKVWLKSGGSIVINQTEALVAIDINTGKYVGKSARLEDTILKTNLDAVPEIVRQIRLRDLGGIIVIDFIDMDERKNRFKVMAALEEALKSDRAPTKVLQFNDFGLVAITRKRVKQSLERTLSVPCLTCQATGMVKSPATVCNEIYIEMRKMRKHFEGSDVMIRVHPETVKVLKANNARWMNELEELIGKNVLLKSDATLHPEQFDIQG
ncbi:MAG TPA: Rne/Rng family ribonuclease [Terracidiphilus sp.]|jgi:ribonuclease G|nr:Rne/Rng family ribonuclease [Terracidiphilus sp.]